MSNSSRDPFGKFTATNLVSTGGQVSTYIPCTISPVNSSVWLGNVETFVLTAVRPVDVVGSLISSTTSSQENALYVVLQQVGNAFETRTASNVNWSWV